MPPFTPVSPSHTAGLSAHILLDITALPLTMQRSTLTDEDWRLMLISMNWVHQRFSQHPENSQGIRWFTSSVESLAIVLRLHPKLLGDIQDAWPGLKHLLQESPLRAGIWKGLRWLEQHPYTLLRAAPFSIRDGLAPLVAWLKGEEAALENILLLQRSIQKPTDTSESAHAPHDTTHEVHTPTLLVHSIGLPLNTAHADRVDIITLPDLSFMLPHAESRHPEANRLGKLMLEQMEDLAPEHHVVVWDTRTATVFLENRPDFPIQHVHICHPCWLMELPSQLSRLEREGNGPQALEKGFLDWCHQYNWLDVVKTSAANSSTAEESEHTESDTSQDATSPSEMTVEPAEFLIVSLRDPYHEDFIATLTAAFTVMLDAMTLLRPTGSTKEASSPPPKRRNEKATAQEQNLPDLYELLARLLIEENGEALSGQQRRRLVCLYTPGKYQEARDALHMHPLYSHVKERVLLLPSTPMNKALLYPKALAYCVMPLGQTFYPTLLEALAYTLPVIGPKRVSLDVLTQEGGVLFDPEHITRLPQFVYQLSQAEQTEKRRKRYLARKAAESRSWQRFGEQLWAIYDTLLTKSN
jgi:hypothetical protein